MVLREVLINTEDGFADLTFGVISISRAMDGGYRLSARGKYKGTKIGFGLTLGSRWERQELENSSVILHWGRASVISLGQESDALLMLLDVIYGTGIGCRNMRDEVSYLAVSLQGNPFRIGQEAVQMKLLFDTDDEERSAGFFINIDPIEGLVELREKDSDYRRGVVLSLAADSV